MSRLCERAEWAFSDKTGIRRSPRGIGCMAFLFGGSRTTVDTFLA